MFFRFNDGILHAVKHPAFLPGGDEKAATWHRTDLIPAAFQGVGGGINSAMRRRDPRKSCSTIARAGKTRYLLGMPAAPSIDPSAPPAGIVVAALYHFTRLARFSDLQAPLSALCERQDVRGTVLLAPEGINGTIAGSRAAIDAVLSFLRGQPEFAALTHKESTASRWPFRRMKVRLKREIVTMGITGIDPARSAGAYVAPGDWNALLADPDTIVIDTRNAYEVAIGTFRGALNPRTASFRDFPGWVRANRDRLDKPKIAMFCTGGIRCEKATAYMKAEGFGDVFHLKGGILKYLEEVPAAESLWDGACFVFDERVSVTHGLAEAGHSLCRACRHPLTAGDRAAAAFEDGVSCPHCFDRRTEADRARYRQRQRQVELAGRRGRRHLGG